MYPVVPFNPSSRELIVQVARGLEPKFAHITEQWRERVAQELGFEPRPLAALKRLTIAPGCTFFCEGDFASFFENVSYFGTRRAKQDVDPRAIARSLEMYTSLCEPHLEQFGERATEARAALEILNS